MKSEFRNVIVTGDQATLESTTEGTSNGDKVSYDSLQASLGSRVTRSAALWPTSTPGASPTR
jgi:hypothetical protein